MATADHEAEIDCCKAVIKTVGFGHIPADRTGRTAEAHIGWRAVAGHALAVGYATEAPYALSLPAFHALARCRDGDPGHGIGKDSQANRKTAMAGLQHAAILTALP